MDFVVCTNTLLPISAPLDFALSLLRPWQMAVGSPSSSPPRLTQFGLRTTSAASAAPGLRCSGPGAASSGVPPSTIDTCASKSQLFSHSIATHASGQRYMLLVATLPCCTMATYVGSTLGSQVHCTLACQPDVPPGSPRMAMRSMATSVLNADCATESPAVLCTRCWSARHPHTCAKVKTSTLDGRKCEHV